MNEVLTINDATFNFKIQIIRTFRILILSTESNCGHGRLHQIDIMFYIKENIFQLLLRIKYFNTGSVRIESDAKWTRNGFRIFPLIKQEQGWINSNSFVTKVLQYIRSIASELLVSLHQPILGIHKTFRNKVDGLVLSDWIVLNPSFGRIKWSKFRFITEAIF